MMVWSLTYSQTSWSMTSSSGSITANKASGGDEIPAEPLQILKDDAVKVHTQYASKFGKLSSDHRIGKGQFSFQSQRKAMPKNAQTTAQFHSSHILGKQCSNSLSQASTVHEL